MSIARLTNVASMDALLSEIRTFLNATGDWTIHRDLAAADEGAAAGGAILVVSNGDCLAGLRSTTAGTGADKLALFDGIAPYAGTPNLDALPGNSGCTMSDSSYTSATVQGTKHISNTLHPGPFPTAHLFSDDPSTYCHVALEVSSGRYRHLVFGNMRKFGTWTGGGYFAGSSWVVSDSLEDISSYAGNGMPFDGGSGPIGAPGNWTVHYEGGGHQWYSVSAGVNGAVTRFQAIGSARGGFGNAMRSIQETPYSGLIAVVPITIWALTATDTPDTIRPIGQIKDMFEINMRNLVPGDSYLIGPDEYVVFPVTTKGDPAVLADTENCGYFGYAYKVTP